MRALILAAFVLPLTTLAAPAGAQISGREVVSTEMADAQIPWFERHGAAVLKVEPLDVIERTGKIEFSVLRGATVTLRPSLGMTAEWLQYTLNEHFVSMAERRSAMPACPLALAGTHARVRSLGSAFAVDIEGDSKASGEEILRRALALTFR